MGLGALGAAAAEGHARRADDVVALVLARPGARGRRLLRAGAPLAAAGELPDQAPADAQGFRTDRALAVLALAAGEALPIEDFFQAAYGFPFAPLRHQQVLHSLVWRMRQRLGDAGELVRSRDEASLGLRLARPVLIPDPRCVLAVSDRVIRALAAVGGASAEEAAAALRLPLRTIQRVIRDLVAEGDCRAERRGRGIVYRVQDTTFTATLPAPRP